MRLATGSRVTVPEVPFNLGVKFLDFYSIERCLVLYLDSIYDLILGMVWLERHEPWIDLRSNTVGATRNVSSEALECHDPTFDGKKSTIGASHCMSQLVCWTSECLSYLTLISITILRRHFLR